MKNRIVIALSAIALIATGIVFTASAVPQKEQGKPGIEGRSQHRRGPARGNPFFGLDLTEEQKSQLETIHQNEREQIQTVRNDSSLSQEEKMAQIKSIFEKSRQQSHAVLTPEQQQKLADRRADGPRGGMRGGPRGGFGGLRGLDLSDEQKASLQEIRKNEREQIQAVINDQSLSKEDRMAQLQSIRKNSHELSQAVLTPEQRQTLEERRANGPRGRFGGPDGPGGRRGGFGKRPGDGNF